MYEHGEDKAFCRFVYDRYMRKCEKMGVKPTIAGREIGIATATIVQWREKRKNWEEPLVSADLAGRMAAYFGDKPEDWQTHMTYLTAEEQRLLQTLRRNQNGLLWSAAEYLLDYVDIEKKVAVAKHVRGDIGHYIPPLDDDDGGTDGRDGD